MAHRAFDVERIGISLSILALVAGSLLYLNFVQLPRERVDLHARNERALAAIGTGIEGHLRNIPQLARSAFANMPQTAPASLESCCGGWDQTARPSNDPACDPLQFSKRIDGFRYVGPPLTGRSVRDQRYAESACGFDPGDRSEYELSSKDGGLEVKKSDSGFDASNKKPLFHVDLLEFLPSFGSHPFDSVALLEAVPETGGGGDEPPNERVLLLHPEGAPMPPDPTNLLGALHRPGEASLTLQPDALAPGQMTIGPQRYWVYARPVQLGSLGRDRTWKLLALSSEATFERQLHKAPLGVFALLFAIIALAVLSFPILKLLMLGASERFTQTDAHLAMGASLLCVLAGTITSADVVFSAHMDADMRTHVRRLADHTASKIRGQLRNAASDVNLLRREIEQTATGAGPSGTSKCTDWRLPVRSPDRFHDTPYVALATDGCQVAKFWHPQDSAKLTPLLGVGDRRYFQQASRGVTNLHVLATADMPTQELPALHLESVFSRNHNRSVGLLTQQVSHEAATTNGPRVSLVQVGYWPTPTDLAQKEDRPGEAAGDGIEIAVVDRDGNVLFHSRAEREHQENLLAEILPSQEVASALRENGNTVRELPEVRYHGVPTLVAVSRIKDSPWSVVALTDNRIGDTFNTLVLSRSVQGAFWTLGVVCLVALLLMIVAGAGNGGAWLWPRVGAEPSCWVATGCNWGLVWSACVLWVQEAVEVAYVLPALSLIATFLVVASPRVGRAARIALCAAGAVLIVVLAWTASAWPGVVPMLLTWSCVVGWTLAGPDGPWAKARPPRTPQAPSDSRDETPMRPSVVYSGLPPLTSPSEEVPRGRRRARAVSMWAVAVSLLAASVGVPTYLVFRDAVVKVNGSFVAWASAGITGTLAEPQAVLGFPEARILPSDTPYLAALSTPSPGESAGRSRTTSDRGSDEPPVASDNWSEVSGRLSLRRAAIFPEGWGGVSIAGAVGDAPTATVTCLTAVALVCFFAAVAFVIHVLIDRLFGGRYPLGPSRRERVRDMGLGDLPRHQDLYIGYGEPPAQPKPRLKTTDSESAPADVLDCKTLTEPQLDQVGVPRDLVVCNLQAVLWDESLRSRVLEILEAALASGHRVQLYSQCDPVAYLREELRLSDVNGPTSPPAAVRPPAGSRAGLEDDGKRLRLRPAPGVRAWSRVLGRCRYRVAERNLPHELWTELQSLEPHRRPNPALAKWLTDECGWDEGLHRIAREILNIPVDETDEPFACDTSRESLEGEDPSGEARLSREQVGSRNWTLADVVREVEQRAELTFQLALHGCTHSQRLALARIAHEGFVNPRLWPEVLDLEERGIVQRNGGLRVRSYAFESFLRRHMGPLDVARLERGTPSEWARVRTPLLGVMAFSVATLFIAAPEAGSIVATGLAPLLAGASGLFRALVSIFSAGAGRSGASVQS